MIDWSALDTAGFVVSRQFLTSAETRSLVAAASEARDVRASQVQPDSAFRRKVNMGTQLPVEMQAATEPVKTKLRTQLLPELSRSTSYATDLVSPWSGEFYYRVRPGSPVYLPHNERDSTMYDDPKAFLNCWILLEREDPERTGMYVVPRDRLLHAVPALAALAKHQWLNVDEEREVLLHESFDGTERGEIPFPASTYREIRYLPPMQAGDALLFRSDVLHATQDSETARLAVNFRCLAGNHVFRKQYLLGASKPNRAMMFEDREDKRYTSIFAAFHYFESDAVTLHDVMRYRDAVRDGDAKAEAALDRARDMMTAELAS